MWFSVASECNSVINHHPGIGMASICAPTAYCGDVQVQQQRSYGKMNMSCSPAQSMWVDGISGPGRVTNHNYEYDRAWILGRDEWGDQVIWAPKPEGYIGPVLRPAGLRAAGGAVAGAAPGAPGPLSSCLFRRLPARLLRVGDC